MKYLLLIVFLAACASSEDRSEPIEGETLLNSFELPDEEKNKFSFEEIKPAPEPTPMPSVDKKSVEEKITVKQKPVLAATPKPIAKRKWPEDYPTEFKKLEAPAQTTWKLFRPLIRVGESLKFDVSYLGIKAGTIVFRVLENGKRAGDLVHHFKATLSSAQYYSYIYRLDDYVESFVLADTFMPLKYTLIQRESGQSVDDLQLFDHENYQSKQWFKRIKDGQTKRDDKITYVPPLFLDPVSLLSFFRGLPLENGDEYFIPVVVRSKLWKITAKVEKLETISVMDKDILAAKIVVVAKPTEAGKKDTVLNLWYAAAPSRELLRFNAELKFGTVLGELVE